jgi:tetratricopeptide (TPR) repeat protein
MIGARHRVGAAAVVVAALAFGVCEAPAAAQTKSEKAATDARARELFAKGDAAYAEGRYEEALAAFQEAHDLSNRPQLLFNISNAFERLGRHAEALDALEKYLASGKARDRDVVQKRIASLKKRVEEKREADRIAKEREREEEERKKRERERDEEEKRKKRDEAMRVENGTERKLLPPEESSRSSLPMVLLVSGGVIAVTGGVFALLTLSARSDAENGCKDAPSGRLCSGAAESALDREQTFGIVADVGIVTGVIVGIVGAYLLLQPSGVRAKMSRGGFGLGGSF